MSPPLRPSRFEPGTICFRNVEFYQHVINLSMCYHVYVIMNAKDPWLSVVRIGHCVPSAGFCLCLYGLHVLSRDVNMIHSTKTKSPDSCKKVLAKNMLPATVNWFPSFLLNWFLHLSMLGIQASATQVCNNNSIVDLLISMSGQDGLDTTIIRYPMLQIFCTVTC